MKKRALLLTAAIASVLTLAMPALAQLPGTGDQKGPACSDLRETQLVFFAEEYKLPDGTSTGQKTGNWNGTFFVRLMQPPCSNGSVAASLVIPGIDRNSPLTDEDDQAVTDTRNFTLKASDFTQKGEVGDTYYEWSTSFTVNEASQFEPTNACFRADSKVGNHVADSSPDLGTGNSSGTLGDSNNYGCGFDTTNPGARSYGARSYG